MAARLGNVAYWIATTIAVPLALLGLAALFTGGRLGLAALFIILANLTWLLGSAIRYVLGGK